VGGVSHTALPKGEIVAKLSDEFRRYAVIGAEQRLLQIAQEAAVIFTAFPELRDRGFMERSKSRNVAQAVVARKRRRMSAEARRKISEAQKARWARQKAQSGGGKKK